jgi:hypothetical protein
LERIAVAIVAVLLGVATLGVFFFLGMRAKSPLVLDAVIWFGRRFANPRAMQAAGTPGAYAAVIRHRGRTSGHTYETPVGADPTDDGFVIALPYGLRANWPRNVLANGSAILVKDGHTYALDRPEIVSMSAVEAWFSPSDQRSHRLFHVDQCLRVRVAQRPLEENLG